MAHHLKAYNYTFIICKKLKNDHGRHQDQTSSGGHICICFISPKIQNKSKCRVQVNSEQVGPQSLVEVGERLPS